MGLVRSVTGDEFVDALDGPVLPFEPGDVVVVEQPPPGDVSPARERLATAPIVVVGREQHDLVDVVAPDDASIDAIVDTVAAAPLASAALVVHLRGVPTLATESALYSALLAGPEFAAWRASTPVRARPEADERAVVVTREGDTLRIELNRPQRHNAFNAQMRDELLGALAVAEAEATLKVTISGRGRSFCAGGDLDEFGTAPDPATAHLVRLHTSVGAAIARIANRVTAHVHGACYGSGIELPAFAGQVIAADDTSIALPELGMGLIPGAGGTVSLPARIGRHATALLALTRQPIDAAAALRLGLVDRVV